MHDEMISQFRRDVAEEGMARMKHFMEAPYKELDGRSLRTDGALLDFQRDLLYVGLFALGLLATGSGRSARHVETDALVRQGNLREQHERHPLS